MLSPGRISLPSLPAVPGFDAGFLHHPHSDEIHPMRLNPRGVRLHTILQQMPGLAFGHLTAVRVSGAEK